MKTTTVSLVITLDDENIPEKIIWKNADDKQKESIEIKAFILSLWDYQLNNTLRLDLWTKQMPVGDMYRFLYETLETLADSYLKATGNKKFEKEFRGFCKKFALEHQLIKTK